MHYFFKHISLTYLKKKKKTQLMLNFAYVLLFIMYNSLKEDIPYYNNQAHHTVTHLQ